MIFQQVTNFKSFLAVEKKTFTDGVEFNKISRSVLLKILSAFEENIHKNLKRKKLKPVFTAQFANNRYTRRFIYPNVYETPKGKTHPYQHTLVIYSLQKPTIVFFFNPSVHTRQLIICHANITYTKSLFPAALLPRLLPTVAGLFTNFIITLGQSCYLKDSSPKRTPVTTSQCFDWEEVLQEAFQQHSLPSWKNWTTYSFISVVISLGYFFHACYAC